MPRSPRSTAPAVTLFPFLAVLLCLMGALVVLLMALSARVGVEPVATPAPPPLPERPPAEAVVLSVPDRPPLRSQEDVDRPHAAERRRLLEAIAALERRLADAADSRAAAERASREYDAELAEAVGRLDRERASLAAAKADAEELEMKLTQLAEQVETLHAERTEATAAAATARPTKFRIMPVDRFTGTQRHPIVVECLPDGFRFATEGVTVNANDFVGRRFEDNPLTNVVEALSVHYGAEGEQPYVLLLARPGAEMSFGLARGLLVSVGRKWGYELIPDGMELDWPPIDEEAKQVALAAIGPAAADGRMLTGRPLSATGDIYGLLRNQRLRSLAMTGRAPVGGAAAAGSRSAAGGMSPADAFLPTHRRPSGGGFEEVARGDFRRPIRMEPAKTASTGDSRSSMDTRSPARSSDADAANRSEVDAFAERTRRKREDDQPHWLTSKPSDKASLPPASQSDGGTAETGPRESSTASKRSRPVRTSQDAGECLACRRKPWQNPGSFDQIGFERTIRVRVEADRLEADDYDLPAAGTYPSKTLARLLTELTLVKLEEWGDPRPGMYWSPVLILEGGGPMAIRIEQAAKIADLPVRRGTTR